MDILTGIVFNIAATKLSPAFRAMHFSKRIPIRLALFILPFEGDYLFFRDHSNPTIDNKPIVGETKKAQ